MSIIATMLAAPHAIAAPASIPACHAAQMRLSLDGRDGDFNGMSHSGVELSIQNVGRACTLPALPKVELRDKRGDVLPAARQSPVGMHPGPVMTPRRLADGDRMVSDLRWVSSPVYPTNRSLHVASITLRLSGAAVRAPFKAVIYGPSGKRVGFDQTPLAPPSP